MKILLSAFACAPNTGSETGVGWRWAIELAKANHEVVVLTDSTREVNIAKELRVSPVPNLTVVCYRPAWLKHIPLNSKTAQLLYSAWQYSLLPFARKLHKAHEFDLIIHLTYGVFRHPSFLGFVGPEFVFGPVGGGEDAPWSLKKSLPATEKFKEIIRSCLNALARYNPFLRLALGRATLILSKTEDTRQALPKRLQHKTFVFPEIGIDTSNTHSQAINQRDESKPLEVLFAGRMLGWKGAHLAIRACAAALNRGLPIHLTMVGNGPLLLWLKTLALKLGINNHVTWIGHIPQQELFALYRQMHCFLFPSLHDSSGNVVLEALSFGLPIVCLDIGGPVTLVNSDCASVISTANVNEQELVESMATALERLALNEEFRLSQIRAAFLKARTMSWCSRVTGVLDLVKKSGGNA